MTLPPPEGFVLVPIEPTKEMWKAAFDLRTPDNPDPDYDKVYEAARRELARGG